MVLRKVRDYQEINQKIEAKKKKSHWDILERAQITGGKIMFIILSYHRGVKSIQAVLQI